MQSCRPALRRSVPDAGNRLAFGNLVEQVELELAGVARPLGQSAEAAALRVGDGLFARDDDSLEDVVGLNLLFHLRLDFLEVLGRDAVRKLHVVVKPILDRRPIGELGLGPQPQDGRGHAVGARVAEALQFGHLRAVIEGFALGVGLRWLLVFVGHKSRARTYRISTIKKEFCGFQLNPSFLRASESLRLFQPPVSMVVERIPG